MDNRANEAYLIAIIDGYDREVNKIKTPTIKSTVLKEVTDRLNDLLTFMSDKTVTESKSTLELNKDLIENVRAYKDTLTDKERVITRLNTKNEELHELWYSMDKGKLEAENKMLEAENLELKSRLAMANVNENIIRGLKSDIQIWQAQCIELREKLEKATKCQWWID